VHSRRQSILIAKEIFQLSIQPSIIVLEIADVHSKVLVKQHDDNTDQEMSDNNSKDP
jgi:hypothetical protein